MSEFLQVKPGMFVDTDEIAPEDVKAVAVQDDNDFPTLLKFKFYPYVKFRSLEWANYGILATRGKAGEDEVESVQIGSVGEMENTAPLMDLNEALNLVKTGQPHSFEDFPFVAVTSKTDYIEVLAAAEGVEPYPQGRKDWSPRRREFDSSWEGSGVYDFRDSPPTQHAASVEEYERQGMEFEATQIIDMTFQGDGWRNDLSNLIELLKVYDQ